MNSKNDLSAENNGSSVTPPKFPEKLIVEPIQSNPPPNIDGLGPLIHLIGTWTNQDLGSTYTGGKASPYSYNIMPLPTSSASTGYILKNFKYYEEITFSPVHGNAPNRGGSYNQNANILFYEQRVYFAEGPAKDKLVHAENGSWLFLATGPQSQNPYKKTPVVPHPIPIPAQPEFSNVAKQMSVPHGNSILAQGGINPNAYIQEGPLKIEDYPNDVIPPTIDSKPYQEKSVGNPYPELNKNPNQPLQDGTKDNPCDAFIHLSVDTQNPQVLGHVTNIPFEERHANVVDYKANYWLQAFEFGQFTQLSYNQTIYMDIKIGDSIVKFPHITCNTLTKKIV
jgi:hypothetical protein